MTDPLTDLTIDGAEAPSAEFAARLKARVEAYAGTVQSS